jgi:hypothetical protein
VLSSIKLKNSGYLRNSPTTFDEHKIVNSFETDNETASLLPPRVAQISLEHIAGVAARLGLSNRIELVKGNAKDTIPRYMQNATGERFALLHLDFDTYDATKAALTHFYPYLVPGGLVIFDEYSVRGWGESDAADEFFSGYSIGYSALPWASSPTAYVLKPPL